MKRQLNKIVNWIFRKNDNETKYDMDKYEEMGGLVLRRPADHLKEINKKKEVEPLIEARIRMVQYIYYS
jgi:hypothetical protein